MFTSASSLKSRSEREAGSVDVSRVTRSIYGVVGVLQVGNRSKLDDMEAMKAQFSGMMRQIRLALRDIGREIRDAQLMLFASSLAYTTILSLIPLLAVSLSIFQAFGGMERLYETIEPLIIQYLAENASDEATRTIRSFIGNIHAGALGATGLIGLIFTSMALLSSAETAINRVWKAEIKRSLFHRIAGYWLFITLGPVAMAFAVGTATSAQVPLQHLIPSGTGSFLLSTLVFFAIYKWVPNRNVDWKPALISATLISILMSLARAGYGLYTKNFVSYDKIYGSLAAIPILLFWIYIVWLVILTGAAVTVALQKRFNFE